MARTRAHIPQSGEELTAEWFTETLGRTHGGQVVAVDRSVIGEGIGFIGELHRCRLTWDDTADVDGRPASVVVKIPAATNRPTGEALQAYEREIVVYRELGGRIGIPMPRYHHDALDPHPAPWIDRTVIWLFRRLPVRAVNWLVTRFIDLSGKSKRRYLLVIEDIDDARPPQQVVGGSVDDAMEALDVLARFHAANWMSEETTGASPLLWPIDQAPKVWVASYGRNRETFVEEFGSVVPAAKMARLDDAQEQVVTLLERLGSPPWTLIHGDYRLDNILYRSDGELVVLDYQLTGRGRGGWDVGYFITTALTPDHRDDEEAMLRRYHSALVEAGVDDYAWEELVADVEATKLVLAHRLVCAADTLDTTMEGDDTLAHVLVERVVGWID